MKKNNEISQCTFKPKILEGKPKTTKIKITSDPKVNEHAERLKKAREDKYNKLKKINNDKYLDEATKVHA